jgi:hypothetical protein
MFLFIGISLSSLHVEAAEETLENGFYGEITNDKSYMEGDFPMTSDFSITGKIIHNNKEYSIDDFNVMYSGGTVNLNTSQYTLTFFHNGSDFLITHTINLKVVKFDPTILYEDSKIFEVNSLDNRIDKYTSISYDSKIKDDLNITDYIGRKVSGDIRFSKNIYNTRIGYTLVNFRFTPSEIKFNVIDSQFIVNFTIAPKITVTKDSIKINLNNNDNRYTFKVNGKEYTKNTITKLDPKTKYKIEIIQNNIPDLVTQQNKSISNVLYTKTVTTKS